MSNLYNLFLQVGFEFSQRKLVLSSQIFKVILEKFPCGLSCESDKEELNLKSSLLFRLGLRLGQLSDSLKGLARFPLPLFVSFLF